jgi:hypothetical protein
VGERLGGTRLVVCDHGLGLRQQRERDHQRREQDQDDHGHRQRDATVVSDDLCQCHLVVSGR